MNIIYMAIGFFLLATIMKYGWSAVFAFLAIAFVLGFLKEGIKSWFAAQRQAAQADQPVAPRATNVVRKVPGRMEELSIRPDGRYDLGSYTAKELLRAAMHLVKLRVLSAELAARIGNEVGKSNAMGLNDDTFGLNNVSEQIEEMSMARLEILGNAGLLTQSEYEAMKGAIDKMLDQVEQMGGFDKDENGEDFNAAMATASFWQGLKDSKATAA